MSLRLKVLLVVVLSVGLSILLVAWQISASAQSSFDRLDEERTAALVTQFQSEMQRRGKEIQQQLDAVAASETALRIGIENGRALGDFSGYVDAARELATAQSLELLQIVSADGTIISSAQWPARFGYKDAAVAGANDNPQSPFLRSEELADGSVLALVGIKPVRIRERDLYLVGGITLGPEFLKQLVLPSGTRVMIYRAQPGQSFIPENLTGLNSAQDASKLSGFVQRVQTLYPEQKPARPSEVIRWTGDPADDETIAAIPLSGRQSSLEAILLVGTSHSGRVAMARNIRNAAFVTGGGVMLLGLLLATVISRRMTRPVEELAVAADRVAAGDWEAAVEVEGQDEIARLAQAFNHMTQELIAQRERLVQTERVAAWRELARRLAHELKNPLFPLQITVENLLRAREHSPQEFDEVFRESSATLLAEIANLKTIIGRFSDFSKMPAPQPQPVQMNELVREVGKLFQAQFQRPNSPKLEAKYELADRLPEIAADPVLLRRAIENLVLNALDAMPKGGALTFRTAAKGANIRLEMTDTGEGLTAEECARLFTPYYTTKQFGTGLGLAIVQSVISDHQGRIWVTSQKGHGTTFHRELPVRLAQSTQAGGDTMQTGTS